jgi:hypothetical protein
VKNLTKAFTMAGVFIFRNGIASGKRVEVHIIAFFFGSSPTQSISIRLNGSSNAGIGKRGAGGIFWFGLPTT